MSHTGLRGAQHHDITTRLPTSATWRSSQNLVECFDVVLVRFGTGQAPFDWTDGSRLAPSRTFGLPARPKKACQKRPPLPGCLIAFPPKWVLDQALTQRSPIAHAGVRAQCRQHALVNSVGHGLIRRRSHGRPAMNPQGPVPAVPERIRIGGRRH